MPPESTGCRDCLLSEWNVSGKFGLSQGWGQPPWDALCRVGLFGELRAPCFRELAARRPDSLRADFFALALMARPLPDFSPPPACLFTVCQARFAAVLGKMPRFS